MRQKFFITLIAAIVSPLAAPAQPSAPVIGFLSTRSPEEAAAHTAAFVQGLKDVGYVEGRNVAIQYRWAQGQYDRLPALAAELTSLRVNILVAGGDPAALAVKALNGRIPVVFMMGDDPVRTGLVASLNRPGGYTTGVSLISSALGAKRLELLREMTPSVMNIGLLVNPNNPNADAHIEDVKSAATQQGQQVVVLRASGETALELGFTAAAREGVGALIVQNDPFFDARRDQIVALAERHKVPAIYHIREFAAAGGLMSYGPSLADAYRRLGVQTARVLKGVAPAELPVERSTRFELVINAKTAGRLGMTVPASILARADEIVE